jgi:hypothetical protein
VLNNLQIWYLIFLPFAFFTLKKRKIALIILSFFILCVTVFYSIKIEQWGRAKYQIELVLPFVTIGILKISHWLKDRNNLLIIVLASYIFLNLHEIYTYPAKNSDWSYLWNPNYPKINKLSKEYSGLIRQVYNKNLAYEYVKEIGLTRGLLTLDNDYGIFPEIVHGFTSKELFYIRNNSTKYENLKKSSNSIKTTLNFLNNNPQINTLILSDWNNEFNSILENLISFDWEVNRSFYNNKHKSFVFVITRCKMK